MNKAWEYVLNAIGQGQSSLEESDLVDGKFDPKTGLFTDSKGKVVGPADKGYDNLYKGIQQDGSFRSPELYKPKHSFIAEAFAPDNVNSIDRANAEWANAPLKEWDSATRGDDIRHSIASKQLAFAQDRNNPEFFSGPYSAGPQSLTRQYAKGMDIGLPEQYANTDLSQQIAAQNASKLASVRDVDALSKGIPFDENDSAQSRALYSKKLNDANSTLIDPETSVRLGDLNRQLNIQKSLYPLVDEHNVYDAQTALQTQGDVRKALTNTARINAGLTGQGVSDLGMDMDTMHTRSAMNNILGRIVGGEGSMLTSPFVQQLGEDGALHRSLNSAADGMTRLMGQAQEDAANKAGSKSGMQLPTGRTLNIPQYRAFGSRDGSPLRSGTLEPVGQTTNKSSTGEGKPQIPKRVIDDNTFQDHLSKTLSSISHPDTKANFQNDVSREVKNEIAKYIRLPQESIGSSVFNRSARSVLDSHINEPDIQSQIKNLPPEIKSKIYESVMEKMGMLK